MWCVLSIKGSFDQPAHWNSLSPHQNIAGMLLGRKYTCATVGWPDERDPTLPLLDIIYTYRVLACEPIKWCVVVCAISSKRQQPSNIQYKRHKKIYFFSKCFINVCECERKQAKKHKSDVKNGYKLIKSWKIVTFFSLSVSFHTSNLFVNFAW